MKTVLELTGLKKEEIKKSVEALKVLLANYQVFYTNLRGFHWHVEGPRFFELHKQFESMYDGVAERIDEIAERLLQLGEYPENRYSENLKLSEVKETTLSHDVKEIVDNIFETYKVLIAKQRLIIELAGEASDEVTVDLMVGFLAEDEKLIWMLKAMTK